MERAFTHGAMGHRINPSWCNKGHGMCYPVCVIMHIKELLLLIGKGTLCVGSGFPLSLSGPLPYVCIINKMC